MENNNIQNGELSFKYHTQEFIDVAEEIRKVGHIGRLAKRQPGLILQFLDSLEFMDELYSPYFKDKNKISTILEKNQDYLSAQKYSNLLSEYNRNPDEKNYKYVQMYEQPSLKQLKKVFKMISNDLVQAELRPKPAVVEEDTTPDGDKTLIQEYKAMKAIIMGK